MSTNSKLQSAVRLALGVSAGALAVSVAPSALAQEGGQDQVIEEIITTGSRIRRADLDSASPVTVINRSDILATGVTDVGNLLQRLPSMSGSPIGTTTNNGGNGSVQVDLRGLGPIRTLTLVNGKRTVDGGDYQTIPSVMVERVEILKDGASAVYGADAVAGVVNIITRSNFEGLTIEALASDWFDSKGAQTGISLIAGKNFDGGNVVFGVEYIDQEEAYQSDTPWDFFQDSWFIYPGGCENQLTAEYDGTPQGGCYPLGSSRIPEGRLNSMELTQRMWGSSTALGEGPRLNDWFNGELNRIDGGDTVNPDFDPAYGVPTFNNGNTWMADQGTGGLVPYDGRTYNYAPVNYIQTPYERLNIFAEADIALSDTISLSGEFRANRRDSAQELAPTPYTPGDPFYNGTWLQPDPLTGQPLRRVAGVDADGDDVFYYTADQGLGEVAPQRPYAGISEDNFYNTLGFPVRDARRRMIESTRRFTQEIAQVQGNLTLAGSFNELDWDVYYNHGYRSRSDSDFGQFNGPNLSNALGPSADLNNDGSPECYQDITDASTIIPGCVPLNLFGGGVPNGTITDDMLSYIGVDVTDYFSQRQHQGGLNLTGAAFDMPGGAMGWAVGYETSQGRLCLCAGLCEAAEPGHG